MHLRSSTSTDRRDLVVTVEDPDATIADLAQALDPGRPVGPLLVDGRLVAAATPLDRAAIAEGSCITRTATGDDRGSVRGRGRGTDGVATLTVTTGFDAGRRFELSAGSYLLGRLADHSLDAVTSADSGGAKDSPALDLAVADPTISAHHARIEVDQRGTLAVVDLGSRNGTWLDDRFAAEPTPVAPGATIRCGAATLLVEAAPAPKDTVGPLTPVRHGGTRPLHRPHRPDPPPARPPVVAPEPLEPPRAITPVGVLGVVASLAFGAVMVLVLGSWAYAMFALLGPVVMIANSLDGRRRRRHERRHGARRRRQQLAAFAEELDQRSQAELIDRDQRFAGFHRATSVAAGPLPTCWERRTEHHDAFQVRIGTGPGPWAPPVTEDGHGQADDVAATIDGHCVLQGVAVGLRLAPGQPVALVGPVEATRAMARAVLGQAVTAHGPADLRVAVFTGARSTPAWDWCAWLPHTRSPSAGSLLAASDDSASRLAAALVDDPSAPPTGGDPGSAATATIVLIDDPSALGARRSPARTALRAAPDPALGLIPLVLVSDTGAVPAACATVLHVGADASLTGPDHVVAGTATMAGAALDVTTELARSLARLEDPEVDDVGRGLPDAVTLPALLGPDRVTAPGLAARWRAAGADPPPCATLGATAEGRLTVDLAADGPHVLVTGTTGAGKSELLRTLVAGLAAGSSPDHLAFVLIDFKGGSAFDACARLPHTAGVVTDLDADLAARALRCLEAELRYRERRLRQESADDLTGFRRLISEGDREPMPRLVVVIDEFATLANELPDFVDALVGIAQRGRSLGVHLVLATQRAAGSVSEHIKANTALRIALRVQSAEDSNDVIGTPDAAALPRARPGRALLRFGPGDLVAAQTALSTGRTPGLGGAGVAAVRVEPLGIETLSGADAPAARDESTDPRTDLEVMVDAMVEAWSTAGGRPPRPPWPEPLPANVAWPIATDDDAGSAGPAGSAGSPGPVVLTLGLADEPDRQQQVPYGWRPDDGPLLLVGLPGSGTTTAAATAMLEAARRWSPEEAHLHVIGIGGGELRSLAGLVHTGAVVGADDAERQRRLIAELSDELARRRTQSHAGWRDGPRRFLVVDGMAGFAERWDALDPSGTWDRLLELVGRGAEVGIHVVLTAEGPGAAPHRLLAMCCQRLVFRLGDRADHAAFAISAADVPTLGPGRAIDPEGPTLVQVARPPHGLGGAVAALASRVTTPNPRRLARPVGVLPTNIGLDQLAAAAAEHMTEDDVVQDGASQGGEVALLVGVSDVGLVPARLRLPPGGHALVAGPPRSGRSTALATLAASAAAGGLRVVAVSTHDGWPPGVVALRPSDPTLGELVDAPGPVVVLIDDADLIAEDHLVLARVVSARRPDRHVVAAGRSDRLRNGYGHWTRELRADRAGLLLVPDPDIDGELTGARLPRTAPVPLKPGRGWLSGGDPEGFLQVALVDRPAGARTVGLR